MPIVERKARQNIEGNYSREDNWLDLFGNKQDKNKFEEAIKPFLPIIGSSFAVLPSNDVSEEEEDNENNTEIIKNDPNSPQQNKKESTSELVNVSSFWILIFITAFLAITLLLTTTTKFVYQHKNIQNGYSQVPESYGIFNEKSRIISVNSRNNPQYM
uniref:Uncharacterized protein n=1 Tax=Meloidogyne floridensis TaxID=298350 RepID=A0A915PAC1_9BILA